VLKLPKGGFSNGEVVTSGKAWERRNNLSELRVTTTKYLLHAPLDEGNTSEDYNNKRGKRGRVWVKLPTKLYCLKQGETHSVTNGPPAGCITGASVGRGVEKRQVRGTKVHPDTIRRVKETLEEESVYLPIKSGILHRL